MSIFIAFHIYVYSIISISSITYYLVMLLLVGMRKRARYIELIIPPINIRDTPVKLTKLIRCFRTKKPISIEKGMFKYLNGTM